MKKNIQGKFTRWSIRRLSVGVASVAVASGFFMITSPATSVLATEINVTPVIQTKPDKVDNEKESKPDDVNKLIKNAVDTALTNQNDSTTPEQVKDGVKENTKDSIDIPAAYLEKAEGVGSFTAGVNQVIPYELFAGDGMLTRLLLKASDKAPWSDNGTAKNPALSPLGENMNTKGQYFYEVNLNGNTVGKQGQALIDQLRENGDHTYNATVKVYGNKDGKPDLTNLIATRNVKIHLNKVSTSTNTSQAMNNMSIPKEEMNSSMMAHQKTTSQDMMKKDNMATLPETGETATNTASLGVFATAFAFIIGSLGLKAKKERN